MSRKLDNTSLEEYINELNSCKGTITLKVINDNGKYSKSKKYMWLYMSETKSAPVILYDYQSTR